MPVAESVSGIRISDPKPSHCAGCLTSSGTDVKFINFYDRLQDRGTIVEEGSMAVLASVDELHLCESCVRSAANALGLKPDVHRKQILEIQRLETQVDHWKDYARTLEATLQTRPEPAPGERARRR
jgi:hypothetical protein